VQVLTGNLTDAYLFKILLRVLWNLKVVELFAADRIAATGPYSDLDDSIPHSHIFYRPLWY